MLPFPEFLRVLCYNLIFSVFPTVSLDCGSLKSLKSVATHPFPHSFQYFIAIVSTPAFLLLAGLCLLKICKLSFWWHPYFTGLLEVRLPTRNVCEKLSELQWPKKCKIFKVAQLGRQKKYLRVETTRCFTEQNKMLRSWIRCAYPNPSGFHSTILSWTYHVFLKQMSSSYQVHLSWMRAFS